jgi:hypothetical protein
MKLEPIVNPHARIKQQTKKSKAEEKDELIESTKQAVIDKYADKKKTQTVRKTDQITKTGENF